MILFYFPASQTADKSQSDTLESEEFVEFYKMLTERKDILALFQEYSSDGQKLSVCDLEDFLREEQLEGDTSQQHAIELIDRYEPSDNGTDHCHTLFHTNKFLEPATMAIHKHKI